MHVNVLGMVNTVQYTIYYSHSSIVHSSRKQNNNKINRETILIQNIHCLQYLLCAEKALVKLGFMGQVELFSTRVVGIVHIRACVQSHTCTHTHTLYMYIVHVELIVSLFIRCIYVYEM